MTRSRAISERRVLECNGARGGDRAAVHRGRHRLRAEMGEDRRREVDRGEQPALARAGRAELPAGARREPADGAPQQRARGAVTGTLQHDHELARLTRGAERPQVREALPRPPGRSATTYRLMRRTASRRARRVEARPIEKVAIRPLRSAASRPSIACCPGQAHVAALRRVSPRPAGPGAATAARLRHAARRRPAGHHGAAAARTHGAVRAGGRADSSSLPRARPA